jgi:hypothetical protein
MPEPPDFASELDLMPWFSRRVWLICLAWTLLGILLHVIWYDAVVGPFPVAMLAWLGWLIGAVVLACLTLMVAIQATHPRRVFISLCVLIVSGATMQIWGGQCTRYLRFRLLKPSYEKQVLSLPPAQVHQFMREPGPPERTAFPWPGGLLDNWRGVVYDPSNELDALVRKPRAPRDHPARRFFGGDIIKVEHLEGPWYFCWFT